MLYRRLQAVKSLESLQKQFNALAMQVKQQTQLANQGSKATSSCLAYDSTANHKVGRQECLAAFASHADVLSFDLIVYMLDIC